MEFDNDHPRVFFPSDSLCDSPTFGFLFIIDGVPWAAKTLEDARGRVPALDPRLLEGLPEQPTGEKQFQYRGMVPRH
jgi:hypothetical protein